MSILKYAAGIPAVAAVVATMYGGLSYVNGLQSTIKQNEKQITQIENDIKNNKVEITSRVTAIDEKTKDKITKILISNLMLFNTINYFYFIDSTTFRG